MKTTFGIYCPDGNQIDTTYTGIFELYYPSRQFIDIHRVFFPTDSVALGWSDSTNKAGDSSWVFLIGKNNSQSDPYLEHNGDGDALNRNVFYFSSGQAPTKSAAAFAWIETLHNGNPFNIAYFTCLIASFCFAYWLTRSLAKRIFLLDLYEECLIPSSDNSLLDNAFDWHVDETKLRKFLKATQAAKNMPQSDQHAIDKPQNKIKAFLITLFQRGNPSSKSLPKNYDRKLSEKDVLECEKKLSFPAMEVRLMELSNIMKDFYSAVWNKLSPEEKFILYDFSLDGFSNHKSSKILYELIHKGILYFDGFTLSTMTWGFQEFVLGKKNDKEIISQLKTANAQDTWKKLKVPLLLLFGCLGIFIFLTQDAIYQKITGLLASSGSLITLISGFLGNKSQKDS
jgi:hypothetical protein